jgi:hypothetical protein
MTKKKLYKYTVRVNDGDGNHEEEVIAEDEVVRNGIVYFETDGGWSYAIGLTNLIDLRVELADEDEAVEASEHATKHVETVLPKENV